MSELSHADVLAARERVIGSVRPVTLTRGDGLDLGLAGTETDHELWLALEFMQFTGSFKARGALNFLLANQQAGRLGEAGVTIASGGNAGLACAWAAGQLGSHATVFLPQTAPQVKVARLRGYGAQVRLVGSEYAEALAACQDFAERSGALASHAYDDPLIAAGAGTLMEEIHAALPELDTVVVAVGGGGLLAGVATAAASHGVRVVAVEPEGCAALAAALRAGHPVDVPVESIAADSLGARRATVMAIQAARQGDVVSVLVPDAAIIAARQQLWDSRRLVVEHGAATALAALRVSAGPAEGPPAGPAEGPPGKRPGYGYRPAPGERVAVVLCGANTDPSDLVERPG